MKNKSKLIQEYQVNFTKNVKKTVTISGLVLTAASILIFNQPSQVKADTQANSQVANTSISNSNATSTNASRNSQTDTTEQANSSANSQSTSTMTLNASLASATTINSSALTESKVASSSASTSSSEVVPNTVGTTNSPAVTTYTGGSSTGNVTLKSSYSTSADAIDVSSYQGAMSTATYTNLKNQGVKYVIVKLTQGTTYTNPYAATQINNAKAAGLKVYAYDYFVSTSTSAAQAEARYFANQAKSLGLDTDTLMIADVEDNAVKRSDINSLLSSYWSTLSSLGYTNHAIYTGYYFDKQYNVSSTVGKSRTWIAAYYYSYWKSTMLGSGYGAWQYTDQYNNSYDGSIDMGLFSSNLGKSGEAYENGHWYLYKDGVKQTGFMKLSDGRVVYYNEAGQMQYGDQTINGYHYYFALNNGDRLTGEINVNGSNYYYAPTTGQRQTGLVYNAATKTLQYYDPTTGKLLTSSNGAYVGNVHIQADGTVDTSTLVNGLNTINGNTYYYNRASQSLVSGWQTVNGKTYYFDLITKQAIIRSK